MTPEDRSRLLAALTERDVPTDGLDLDGHDDLDGALTYLLAEGAIDESAFVALHEALVGAQTHLPGTTINADYVPDATPSRVEASKEGARTRMRGRTARANARLLVTLRKHGWVDDALLDRGVAALQGGQVLTEWLVRQNALSPEQLRTLAGELPGMGLCTDCGSVVDVGGERLEIVAQLDRGGMGAIHVARDNDLRRKVAVKSLLPNFIGNTEVVDRFFHEAQITAQLDHPAVVPVHSLKVDADGPSYSMKLVRGVTFSTIIKQTHAAYEAGEQPEHDLHDRLEMFLKVCDAMEYAHAKGVLHRDIKPDNVMVGRYGEVYVMDWGIARIIGERNKGDDAPVDMETLTDTLEGLGSLGSQTETMTRQGQMLGTPAYMSPEQIRGEHHTLDARSDQFSLGMMLYQLVCLKRAAQGPNVVATIGLIQAGVLQPVAHTHGVTIKSELRAIIEKSLSRDREDRYATTADFAEDIRAYLRGDAVEALADNPFRAAKRWVAKHRGATLMLVLGLMLLLALATIFQLVSSRRADERARARQARLGRFATAVGRQAERVNAAFLRVERRLEVLAATAGYALTLGTEVDEEPFVDPHDGEPKARPGDLLPSRAYGRDISVEHPIFRLAPGVDEASSRSTMRRMLALRPLLKRALLEGSAEAERATDPLVRAEIARESENPVVWVFVGIERGVHLGYPGKFGYSEGYDPRKRPWYQAAAKRRKPTWCPPYVDASGRGVMLSCAQSVRATDSTLLGVAGIDVQLSYIVKRLLPLFGERTRQTYLTDSRARVLVRSGAEVATLEPEPLPFPSVRQAITSSSIGLIHLRDTNPPRLVGFARLDSVGWYYVVEADANEVLDQP